MACLYKDRHGLTGEEIQSLSNKFYIMNGRENWDSFDDFLLWCQDNGYRKDRRMRRINNKLPHSKENSYFHLAGDSTPPQKAVQESEKKHLPSYIDAESPLCQNCKKKECCNIADGCVQWKECFVKNWNRNICRAVKQMVRPAEQVFRYEHPDLVREGIVWAES